MKQLLRSILTGIGSLLDLSGSARVPKPMTPSEAREHDARAMRGDWEAVGRDIRKAMKVAKGVRP